MSFAWKASERDRLARSFGIARVRQGSTDIQYDPLSERLELFGQMNRAVEDTPTHRFAVVSKGT